MDINHNVIGWVEIPVANMERAVNFYEAVFDFKLELHEFGNLHMAWFPYVDNGFGSGCSLNYLPGTYKPSADGVLVYFTAFSGDLNNELSRVEANGGKVLQGKTLISDDYGYMGLFLDTEGNRIALHSLKEKS